MSTSQASAVASGVISRGPKPVPPVVMIRQHSAAISSMAAAINERSSETIRISKGGQLGIRGVSQFRTSGPPRGDRTLATTGKSQLIAGDDKIVEQLLGLNFEISMKSFFQTNPKSAEKLYTKVIDYALENKETIDNSVVMDLFCGTGTIGQILASRSTNTKIIGVDIVASAVEDAIKNAERNNIHGLQFYTADVGKFLTKHPEYKNKIRTIILDPARAGIAPKTLY